MPAVSWTNPHNIAPEPESEYIAMITYLPVAGYSKLPMFFMHVSAVQGQLASAKGLLGYMMRADVLTKKQWPRTLTTWVRTENLSSLTLKAATSRSAGSACFR